MAEPQVLGVDTSCYTTSVACVSLEGIVFETRTMLSVPLGERGLRQSEGVFQHVRNLPAMTEALFCHVDRSSIKAVAVSAAPTGADESYMPVFLAGKAAASAMAAALDVPLLLTNHQAGHVRAALLGNETLLEQERFLALHLSGGTTDLLLVRPEAGSVGEITRLGGSGDLHAGQFVDRVGVALGLPFPCGPHLEKLALDARERNVRLPSTVRGLDCSLSGQETQAARLLKAGTDPAELAYGVYDCLARTVWKLLRAAGERYGELPALLSGGVSGSGLLRELLAARTGNELYYAKAGLSGDNAVGAALLGLDRVGRNAG